MTHWQKVNVRLFLPPEFTNAVFSSYQQHHTKLIRDESSAWILPDLQAGANACTLRVKSYKEPDRRKKKMENRKDQNNSGEKIQKQDVGKLLWHGSIK